MQVNGPEDEKLARKKALAVSVACTDLPQALNRNFKLCVYNRWDFNFCVRSSPLRGYVNLPSNLTLTDPNPT